jgi:hypothetical protein
MSSQVQGDAGALATLDRAYIVSSQLHGEDSALIRQPRAPYRGGRRSAHTHWRPPPQAGLARELSHSFGDTLAICGFSGQPSRLHAPGYSLYDQTPNDSR